MRKTLAALIGAAATVTMITGAGVAVASASHPAASSRPAAVSHPASPHAAISGREHFQAVSASLSGTRSRVAAYGAFNASGIDTSTSNTRDTFTFPGGSFRVTHKVTHSRQHFSKVTCAGVVHQRGTYRLSKGTGRYAGISGHGRFRVRVLIVSRHTSSGCGNRPIAIQTVIRARGPVSVP
jgi:hypothetical protein